MKKLLLALLLLLPLWAQNDPEMGEERFKLEIETLGEAKRRFKLSIAADGTAPLADQVTLAVEEGGETRLIVLEPAGAPEANGDRLYSAVEFLPDPKSKRRYYLRGLYGPHDDQAVMIRFVIFKY